MAFIEVRPEYDGDNLRPSSYDRVASLILALLVLVGGIVLVLFGLWVLPHQKDEYVIVYQPTLVESDGDDEEIPFEFETPDPSELPGVPLLQTPALLAASVDKAMAAVRQIDTAVVCEFTLAPTTQLGQPTKAEEIPRWERWKIEYTTSNVDNYARQLDYFEIELGVAGGGKKNVDYASGFANSRPDSRSAPGHKDARLHMIWRDDPIRKMDEQLLGQAGIVTKNRVILHFYPAGLEATLSELELVHANGRLVEEIQTTAFGIRREDGGYEIIVVGQTYRRPKKTDPSGEAPGDRLDSEVLVGPT